MIGANGEFELVLVVPQVLQLLYYFLRFECFCSLRGLMYFFHLVMLQKRFQGNYYFKI